MGCQPADRVGEPKWSRCLQQDDVPARAAWRSICRCWTCRHESGRDMMRPASTTPTHSLGVISALEPCQRNEAAGERSGATHQCRQAECCSGPSAPESGQRSGVSVRCQAAAGASVQALVDGDIKSCGSTAPAVPVRHPHCCVVGELVHAVPAPQLLRARVCCSSDSKAPASVPKRKVLGAHLRETLRARHDGRGGVERSETGMRVIDKAWSAERGSSGEERARSGEWRWGCEAGWPCRAPAELHARTGRRCDARHRSARRVLGWRRASPPSRSWPARATVQRASCSHAVRGSHAASR
jgi:hypothetical protein